MSHSVEGAVTADGKVETLLASCLSLLCVSYHEKYLLSGQ